jgi:thymidylate kinase
MAADPLHPVTFFCGGSRNFVQFIDLFDGVFVLEVDLETLTSRLSARSPHDWGGRPEERKLIVRLHRTKEDLPKNGISIDATKPLGRVVDEIVRRVRLIEGQRGRTW